MTKIVSNITRLDNIRQNLLEVSKNLDSKSENTPAFGNQIKNALENVAEAQKTSADLAMNYELGKETDLTKVKVSEQVSSLAFQMTLNVRNKVLSAYKDIMNMPV